MGPAQMFCFDSRIANATACDERSYHAYRQVASAAQLAAGMKPKKPAETSGFTREDIPKNVKRVIIKVGTSVLTRDQEFGVSLTAIK